jgi:hypothetical protein
MGSNHLLPYAERKNLSCRNFTRASHTISIHASAPEQRCDRLLLHCAAKLPLATLCLMLDRNNPTGLGKESVVLGVQSDVVTLRARHSCSSASTNVDTKKIEPSWIYQPFLSSHMSLRLFESESDSESNSDMIGFKRSPDQVSYHIQQKAVPTLQVDVYMLEVAVLEKSPRRPFGGDFTHLSRTCIKLSVEPHAERRGRLGLASS